MLPKNQRLRLSQDLSATVRSGVRSGRRNVVLYARSSADPTGDRVGFIVSKSVGNAVQRNLAKRRMREVARELRRNDSHLDVVIRALPGAAQVDWQDLHEQISVAWSSVAKKCGEQ